MLNGVPGSYRPSNSEPMSQGTRCRQLALYMIFDSPLNMLCDSPSNYRREPECTGFIAEVPTTWDETRVLNASMGEYIVTARRKGNSWYVGGITDRTPRDIKVDLSFLAPAAIRRLYSATGLTPTARGAITSVLRRMSMPIWFLTCTLPQAEASQSGLTKRVFNNKC